MARRNLSKALISAGQAFLAATDALDMQAQGAMWVYSHMLDDWRFYLVTSLVDSQGRTKTYKLLLEAVEKAQVPAAITIEDVHLGSPADPFFQTLSSAVAVEQGVTRFKNVIFDGDRFDGAIYRSVEQPTSFREARNIEKTFAKRVRDPAPTNL